MKRGIRKLLPAALLALTVIVAGCTSSKTTGSSSDSGGGTLVVDWATGNVTLDPAAACAPDDRNLISNLYSTLVSYGTKTVNGVQAVDTSQIKPGVATKWTVSPDGTQYTFTLKAGAKFPDGSPLDAAAVKYSIERNLKINRCGAYIMQGDANGLITSVTVSDPQTLVVKLKQPSGELLRGLASPSAGIVDPKLVDAHGGVVANQANDWMASHDAGSGAYTLASYSPNSAATLKANPAYIGATPKVSTIQINYITSGPTLLLRAQSGQADVTLGMPLDTISSLQSNSCCKIVAVPGSQYAQISMQYKTAPFNNVKVRQALALAIPYTEILKNVAHGYGSLYYGPVPPNIPGYSAAESAPLTTDVAKAKDLIAQSGLPTPIKATMIVSSASPITVQLATAAQSIWQQIGVDVTIDQLAPGDFTTKFTAGQYQMSIDVESPTTSAGSKLPLVADCTSQFNNAHVCIDGVDDLIAKAAAQSTDAAAQPYYDQITQLWRANWPRVVLFELDSVAVVGKRVTAYTGGDSVNFATWALAGK